MRTLNHFFCSLSLSSIIVSHDSLVVSQYDNVVLVFVLCVCGILLIKVIDTHKGVNFAPVCGHLQIRVSKLVPYPSQCKNNNKISQFFQDNSKRHFARNLIL